MDVCLLWVLCVVRYRSLRWTHPLSSWVLPTVVCHCVFSETSRIRRSWPALGCCARDK
jgi:hypothetical protein